MSETKMELMPCCKCGKPHRAGLSPVTTAPGCAMVRGRVGGVDGHAGDTGNLELASRSSNALAQGSQPVSSPARRAIIPPAGDARIGLLAPAVLL